MSGATQQEVTKPQEPAIQVEMTSGDGSHVDVEATTGNPAKPKSPAGTFTVTRKEWNSFLEEQASDLEKDGEFAKAARLRGKSYQPTFTEAAIHTAMKIKSATVKVLIAAATPVALILVWEGIRFIIPRARTLPGFIKYKPALGSPDKVVRLAAR